jgi:hypothetical protein
MLRVQQSVRPIRTTRRISSMLPSSLSLCEDILFIVMDDMAQEDLEACQKVSRMWSLVSVSYLWGTLVGLERLLYTAREIQVSKSEVCFYPARR